MWKTAASMFVAMLSFRLRNVTRHHDAPHQYFQAPHEKGAWYIFCSERFWPVQDDDIYPIQVILGQKRHISTHQTWIQQTVKFCVIFRRTISRIWWWTEAWITSEKLSRTIPSSQSSPSSAFPHPMVPKLAPRNINIFMGTYPPTCASFRSRYARQTRMTVLSLYIIVLLRLWSAECCFWQSERASIRSELFCKRR